jgi:hypothetical protein
LASLRADARPRLVLDLTGPLDVSDQVITSYTWLSDVWPVRAPAPGP